MTTTPLIHQDESPQSPRSQGKGTPFSIPSSRRRQRSPSPPLYTPPHRTGNSAIPLRGTPYRATSTTANAITPSGRRNEVPDLRNTLRRRYTTLDHRPYTNTTSTTSTTTASAAPSPPTARRTQSLANFDSKNKAAGVAAAAVTEQEPWTREHWVLLSSYYEDMNRDLNGTAEVFYRHESLRSEETETGRKVIIELWPPHKVKRLVKCLEIAAKRHHGMPLQDRITAFEERKRKRVSSELETDLQDHLDEAVPPKKKSKAAAS